ncbi:N-acyl-D-amino-acid deacylase family protein [Thalassomonas haliotis]|uniref:Amidohydrolase family protein n=1 Tax=Thalassomonas haliotis TaxID=485448 RepID=A0ABY7V7A5_9GAMM|nr:amidohydrolase family protein [Thalassomonas haliotis]WDE09559.1 amidohydrolase family protein [Thalassomonas haliotis]
MMNKLKLSSPGLRGSLAVTILVMALAGCAFSETAENNQTNLSPQRVSADILITGGRVYTGIGTDEQILDIAVCGEKICGLYPSGSKVITAGKVINARGKIVSPGFIDPHTHTLEELSSQDKNHNLNYLTQGVTTVVNGNDGAGPVDIAQTATALEENGIGTNVALLVGHGSVREQVMGRAPRFATAQELKQMSALLDKAMQAGALGLSTGLYYVPGSFANTEEVVTLAKVASQYKGIYDTHLRDESTFNIGFSAALDEAIFIAESADIHLHLAHIKALGVDVWGQSQDAIKKIEQAQASGLSISADQYPWLASGTMLHSAVMPKWAMADSQQAFFKRLNDTRLSEKLRGEIKENIRRRGGPGALLITAFKDPALVGLTLAELAKRRGTDAVTAAIALVQQGDVRVASFNMSAQDVENFMVQPWVVTSSDGTNGHPRKYASFPKKYQQYVVKKELLTLGEFINKSSSQTAKILGLENRGRLAQGYQADIIVFDAQNLTANADFSHWNKYSSGIEHVIVNGQVAIEQGEYTNKLAGKFVH